MVQAGWNKNSWWLIFLAPLSLLFWLISGIRRKLYKKKVLPSYKSKLPVIVVGNVSVGGNGKTPACIAIVEKLKELDYRPVILSRGYGGTHKTHPHHVTLNCEGALVGDEPALFARRQLCEVVVDPKRARGAKFIEEKQLGNIIVCDDGLQHYALARDLEVCVLDSRGLSNGRLLPMGPLREGKWRLSEVDICLLNLGANDFNKDTQYEYLSDVDTIAKMTLKASSWVNLKTRQQLSIDDLPKSSAHTVAMAGIGHPARFFQTLDELVIDYDEQKALADHYKFCPSDIQASNRYLMTEKDAVKCMAFAHNDCWYLKVDAKYSSNLMDTILLKLNK